VLGDPLVEHGRELFEASAQLRIGALPQRTPVFPERPEPGGYDSEARLSVELLRLPAEGELRGTALVGGDRLGGAHDRLEALPGAPARGLVAGVDGDSLERPDIVNPFQSFDGDVLVLALAGDVRERRQGVDPLERCVTDLGGTRRLRDAGEGRWVLETIEGHFAHRLESRRPRHMDDSPGLLHRSQRGLGNIVLAGFDGQLEQPFLGGVLDALVFVIPRPLGQDHGILDLLESRPPHLGVRIVPQHGLQDVPLLTAELMDGPGPHLGLGVLPVGGAGAKPLEECHWRWVTKRIF